MDHSRTNTIVSRTTNAEEIVKFRFKGPCGVGTETFIMEKVLRPEVVLAKARLQIGQNRHDERFVRIPLLRYKRARDFAAIGDNLGTNGRQRVPRPESHI